MSQPRIGIIVLNYNGGSRLLSCLKSLERLTYPNASVLVVDNRSTDGSLECAKAEFPRFGYLQNGENLGFAGGMNRGMERFFAEGCEYCWLFNCDAEAMPGTLSRLVEAATRYPDAGLLSPIIVDDNGNVWFEKGRIDSLRMRALHIAATHREKQSLAYESPFLTGCALLVKRDARDAVGQLDERFFLYYEDADYTVRMRRAGFAALVVPKARVSHGEVSRENPQKIFHLVLSGLFFFDKHASRLESAYFSLYVTIRRLKNALKRLFSRHETDRWVYKAHQRFRQERKSQNRYEAS